ncbi:MAG TPA: ArsI/CadI family heavy metal resistance metalloenzyme [Planctomycetota bacterium]|nr:ArsI/CadI family heavy metal resistance metalloenzyme [Planctomycetota bacterium]
MSSRAARIHLSLRVHPERVPALVAFYSTLFGVGPRKRHDDYVQFDLDEPPLNLTLTPSATARRGEVDHLGIQVFSEAALLVFRRRLGDAGLVVRDEAGTECCYARQDKFWLTDPEGREVEVFHKLADIQTHGGGTPTPAPSACCAPDGCADG